MLLSRRAYEVKELALREQGAFYHQLFKKNCNHVPTPKWIRYYDFSLRAAAHNHGKLQERLMTSLSDRNGLAQLAACTLTLDT